MPLLQDRNRLTKRKRPGRGINPHGLRDDDLLRAFLFFLRLFRDNYLFHLLSDHRLIQFKKQQLLAILRYELPSELVIPFVLPAHQVKKRPGEPFTPHSIHDPSLVSETPPDRKSVV